MLEIVNENSRFSKLRNNAKQYKRPEDTNKNKQN